MEKYIWLHATSDRPIVISPAIPEDILPQPGVFGSLIM